MIDREMRVDAGRWVAHEHLGNSAGCQELDAKYAESTFWPGVKREAIELLEKNRPPVPQASHLRFIHLQA